MGTANGLFGDVGKKLLGLRLLRGRQIALDSRAALPQYMVLALLGFALYSTALWIPPTFQDDLKYLTSVSHIGNPLKYFVQDHGHGNHLYRPLTSVSLWLAYKAFGVWALPNQLFNLLLHLANGCLLFRIARRAQVDNVLALLAAALFLASPYTMTVVTKVSDRPMGFVGLFYLLLVDHLTAPSPALDRSLESSVRPAYVGALSILALMGKESGLVIPGLILSLALFAWRPLRFSWQVRVRLVVVSLAVMAAYLLLRILIFGQGYADYGQGGYMLLGAEHYEHLSDLSLRRQALAIAENVGKNLLAPIFPIFDDAGRLLTVWYSLAWSLPLIFSTMLLARLAANRRNLPLQLIAVATVILSALVHCTLFRYRLQYLSQIAFCLFLVPPRQALPERTAARHGTVVKLLAATLLLSSVVWISQGLANVVLERNSLLTQYRHSFRDLPSNVDEQIMVEILKMYP